MLLSWSLMMSTLQSPVVIFQSSSFDLLASFVMVNHSFLSEALYLASGALYSPGFPPILVATPFHSPLLNPLHLAVLSTLEHLRIPPWITFWTLCSLNTLGASFILMNLNTIYMFITPTFLIPALTSWLQTCISIYPLNISTCISNGHFNLNMSKS